MASWGYRKRLMLLCMLSVCWRGECQSGNVRAGRPAPTTTTEITDGDDNTEEIAGGVASGVVVLIVLIVILYCCNKRGRGQSSPEAFENALYTVRDLSTGASNPSTTNPSRVAESQPK
ncbi:hypothetical protein BaRGS_00019407 [Batillaria attramentaria]|uniref:Uncharacterized protein n=1 Tax=Batillaria attramentaria TaxID=370345 RepID=A0ABD0KQ71_9CAEN